MTGISIEMAVEKQYGAKQEIAGLPPEFSLHGDGTDGTALFHSPCESVVEFFWEEATPEAIVQAAKAHLCPTQGRGMGSG